MQQSKTINVKHAVPRNIFYNLRSKIQLVTRTKNPLTGALQPKSHTGVSIIYSRLLLYSLTGSEYLINSVTWIIYKLRERQNVGKPFTADSY